MADWSDIQFAYNNNDYIYRLEQLRIRSLAFVNEVEAARFGEVSLIAGLTARFLLKVDKTGLDANFSANGFRITGLPAPAAPDDAVTKSYADSLSFAAALPAQAGNAGKEIVTDGTTASWGISAFSALGVLNSIGY